MTDPVNQYPAAGRLADALRSDWPEHAGFLDRRFSNASGSELEICDLVAGLILRLNDGEIDKLCADYRWMCGLMMREDVHFRRTGRYRLSTIEQAVEAVYGDSAFMGRYLNGLLLSQVIWRNQTAAIERFVREFLPNQKSGGAYLEIGPGHGIYAYLAAESGRFSSMTGWDISETSLQETRDALTRLGTQAAVDLCIRDIQKPAPQEERYNSIVISEVLEHLENPMLALKTLRTALAPGGQIFINVPVNSPAPDHIYLWETPEDVTRDVENCGLKILSANFEPMTGFDLAGARRSRTTISVVIIAGA